MDVFICCDVCTGEWWIWLCIFLGEDVNNPQHLFLCAISKEDNPENWGIWNMYGVFSLIFACVHLFQNHHYYNLPCNLTINHMYHSCKPQDFSNASFQTHNTSSPIRRWCVYWNGTINCPKGQINTFVDWVYPIQHWLCNVNSSTLIVHLVCMIPLTSEYIFHGMCLLRSIKSNILRILFCTIFWIVL